MSIIRTYTELITLPTFEERYEYLKLTGAVGRETFGVERYLNQKFYRSKEWKDIRNYVITRDLGCDLGLPGYPIYDKVIIHHMNPISVSDLAGLYEEVLDPNFLITTCHQTHNAIHYGDADQVKYDPIERKPGDTCPWK